MKYLTLVLVVAITVVGCNPAKQEEENTTEDVVMSESENTGIAGKYGADLSNESVMDMLALQTSLDESTEFTGKVKVKIEDVCQMKGCWMTAQLPDGRMMRITFKDYGFFVPKNATGFTATIEGDALKKVVDEATRKHYAQESGKPTEDIEGPGEEISFVASGVLIETE